MKDNVLFYQNKRSCVIYKTYKQHLTTTRYKNRLLYSVCHVYCGPCVGHACERIDDVDSMDTSHTSNVFLFFSLVCGEMFVDGLTD